MVNKKKGSATIDRNKHKDDGDEYSILNINTAGMKSVKEKAGGRVDGGSDFLDWKSFGNNSANVLNSGEGLSSDINSIFKEEKDVDGMHGECIDGAKSVEKQRKNEHGSKAQRLDQKGAALKNSKSPKKASNNVKKYKKFEDVNSNFESRLSESMVANRSSTTNEPLLISQKHSMVFQDNAKESGSCTNEEPVSLKSKEDADLRNPGVEEEKIEKRHELFKDVGVSLNISKQRYDEYMEQVGAKAAECRGNANLQIERGQNGEALAENKSNNPDIIPCMPTSGEEQNSKLRNCKDTEMAGHLMHPEERALKEKTNDPVSNQENLKDLGLEQSKEVIRHLENTINMHIRKKENMRAAIKTYENNLRIRDQELLLLRQKISTLEANTDLEGEKYIEECVQRGEALTKILSEEIKNERNAFQERLGEEVENSRMLSKKIDSLKKIINELVKKVKREKQRKVSGP